MDKTLAEVLAAMMNPDGPAGAHFHPMQGMQDEDPDVDAAVKRLEARNPHSMGCAMLGPFPKGCTDYVKAMFVMPYVADSELVFPEIFEGHIGFIIVAPELRMFASESAFKKFLSYMGEMLFALALGEVGGVTVKREEELMMNKYQVEKAGNHHTQAFTNDLKRRRAQLELQEVMWSNVAEQPGGIAAASRKKGVDRSNFDPDKFDDDGETHFRLDP